MAEELTYKPRGLYFEDMTIGDKIITVGRTITETDIVNFAGISGDWNQIHTDEQFAAEWQFGKRIAHGLLIQSVASGLAVQTGFIEGTVIAFRELESKFSLPVFIGDTIHVLVELMEKKTDGSARGWHRSDEALCQKSTRKSRPKGKMDDAD